MYLLKVIPITNLPFQDSYFFYYSAFSLKQGSIVEIPFKNRLIYGIVLQSEKLIKYKKILKEISYPLKKISKAILDFPAINSYQFLIANFLSQYYYCSLPLAFKTILPPKLKNFFAFLKKETNSSKISSNFSILKETFKNPAIQETKDLVFIQEKIEYFKKSQILFLTPTIFHLNFFKNILNNPIVFKKNSTLKAFQVYKEILEGTNNLILGNRSAVFLPWTNLKLIIIEDPNNPSYKSIKQKPYFNAIRIAQKLSLYHQTELIFYYDN